MYIVRCWCLSIVVSLETHQVSNHSPASLLIDCPRVPLWLTLYVCHSYLTLVRGVLGCLTTTTYILQGPIWNPPLSLMTCFNAVATFQVVLEAAMFCHSYMYNFLGQLSEGEARTHESVPFQHQELCVLLFSTGTVVHVLVYFSPKIRGVGYSLSRCTLPALTNGTILTQLHLLIN